MRIAARSALQAPALSIFIPGPQRIRYSVRFQSTSSNPNESAIASLNPRWLSDLKSRIGKCIQFGLSTAQVNEAGSVLQEMASNWRDLVAGSEGFLTGPDQRGLYRQEVVWGEMYGHVNNVIYNRYAESARVNWVLNYASRDPTHSTEWESLIAPVGIGMILRSIRTDYKFPMTYPDRVTVLHKLRDRPRSDTDHFILDVLILSERHRRPAARCVEDIVIYDYKFGRKSPMQPFMVEMLQETFALQEQAKQTYGNKVTDLIRRVQELEKSSWDRPDAKEDFGSVEKS